MLGGKLRKYREQLQESIADLESATGIPAVKLTGIEAGRVEPTGDEVLILADHFRCDFRYFISNERVAPFEQTDTLYRRHGSAFTTSDRRAVQEFLYLAETEAFLMKELGRPHVEFDFKPTGKFMKKHGEAAAESLRHKLGHSDRQLRLDVFSEFRRIGIHVFRRRLGNSDISGMFVLHPTAGKCVLINYSEDVYRQRFSAAHEAAHAIFDQDQEASVTLESDQRDLREVRANQFASCFLMPPVLLGRILVKHGWNDQECLEWANRLMVSCSALGIALHEAGLIDGDRAGQVRALRVPRENKRDPELPDNLTDRQRLRKAHLLEQGLSDFYVELCFDAFSENKISRGRLAESLLTDESGLRELAELYGRSAHAR